MCYNCGCGQEDDDMGKGQVRKGGGSLTDDDIAHMAAKWDMSVQDTQEEIFRMLKKKLGK